MFCRSFPEHLSPLLYLQLNSTVFGMETWRYKSLLVSKKYQGRVQRSCIEGQIPYISCMAYSTFCIQICRQYTYRHVLDAQRGDPLNLPACGAF
jgi:hypothetical protein